MFGEFIFPDDEGTIPTWESLSWLQKNFMVWFNKERLRTIITFPVESFALVYKDNKFLDQESADFVAEEYARGHSFFTYISDTVDSLSSCCFEGHTPIMYVPTEQMKSNGGEGCFVYEDIKDAYEKYQGQIVQVYQETINVETKTCIGEWKEAEFVKAQANQEIDIYLVPDGFTQEEWKDVIRVTPDHIFPVMTNHNNWNPIMIENGVTEKYAYLLETGDELLFEEYQYDSNLKNDMVSGEQNIIIRSIAKVVHVDLETPKDYYCFKILDETVSPYFLMPNGLITHNCRLKNKIQTKEFNFTNGNLGVNNKLLAS